MNKLSYRINKEAILTSYPTEVVGFEIVLDDIPTNYFFSIPEFKESSEKDGYYIVFEGSCQTMGCCGAYAQVVHDKDKVIWKKFFAANNDESNLVLPENSMPGEEWAHQVKTVHLAPDRLISAPIEFSKSEYQKLARELEVHNG